MSYSRAIFFRQKQPADEKQTREILAETLLSDWTSGCNLNFQLASHSYSVRLFSSPRLNYENCPLPMYIVPHFTYWDVKVIVMLILEHKPAIFSRFLLL